MWCVCYAVRGCRPGKTVHMTEAEVRALCLKSREIFLSQPILLELEAPLKICGKAVLYISKGICNTEWFNVSLLDYCACQMTADTVLIMKMIVYIAY